MRTKIVYCLVSNENDYFYEQLLISLVSLRKHNPTANVYVVCDKDTYNTLTGVRAGVFDYATEVIPVDVPKDWHNWKRSRYIKTNLRSIISGDFLYIDVDTVICDALDIVDAFTFDVGAVYDCHIEHPIPQKPEHETEIWITGEAKKVGQNVTGLWHFNGGLLYVKDSAVAHQLYKKWYEKYNENQAKGVIVDQLPLMQANKELGEVITPMNPIINCQAIWKEGKEIIDSAKIIHYFPKQKHYILSTPWILDPIKETGKLPKSIMRIIDKPYDFFRLDSSIVYGDAIDLIKSPMMEIYTGCHNLYRVLEFIAVNYLRLKVFVWRMVHRK